jgi:hypothetical protein
VDAIKRVRSLAGVNLIEVMAQEEGASLLGRLADDPILLCDVLFAVCRPQAEAAGVTDEDFGRAMAGDAIEAATTALLEDLADFFPGTKRRVLHKVLGKLTAFQQQAARLAEERLDSQAVETMLASTLVGSGPSSGSLPGPSGLTPAR